jgi:hypothetical protein
LNNDDPSEFLSGWIFNHSAGEQPTDIQALTFFWFLNLASRYRDLRLAEKHLLFNFKKMVEHGVPIQHMLLLGWEGPFGPLHSMDSKKDFVFKRIDKDPRTCFYNNDKDSQGALAWCIFMYDTILSLDGKSCLKDEMNEPFLGLICHTDVFFKKKKLSKKQYEDKIKVTSCLYQILRLEM